ncbi:MAG: NADH-quinone oxidoreductase subunit N [Desulfuromonadales bacterium]
MSPAELFALLPIIILALGSTAILMLGIWWPNRHGLFLSGVVIALAAAAAAIFLTPSVSEVAGMVGTGPYGRFFTALWSLVGAMTLVVSVRYSEEQEFSAGEYISLILFAACGMAFLSAATSLVGLFLGLEAFTLVLYILIAFHKNSAEGAEAGLKYLVLGAVATGFLAFGIALIYASSGTFHLPEAMAGIVDGGHLRPLGLLGWTMLLAALGFKISLVPFHLWTPDVYQGAPAPVAGLLSTGSKGAVFAVLVTLLSGWSGGRSDLVPLLWVLAALSMVIGTLCALRQENIKRMLAYSSIVHMGYIAIALIAGGRTGNGAVLFYVLVYSLANLGAFGVITALSGPAGEPQDHDAYRGAGYRHPLKGAALSLFLLSLAGIPPTAGFIGKFAIFHSAIRSGYTGLALIGVLTSLISLYYYLRPVVVMYMGDQPAVSLPASSRLEKAYVVLCLGAVLLLGLYPGPLWDLITVVLPSP